MEDLAKDPIIEFYLRMATSTDFEAELPAFSETMLRLAFKEVLGKLRPLNMSELHLYRKLILFYFSETYKSVEDLFIIMSCFTEDDFNKCFEQYDETIEEWHVFMKEHLKNILCKEAFYELLLEWSRRYMHLHGGLPKDVLYKKAMDARIYLRWDAKYLKPCIKNFENMLTNRWKDPNALKEFENVKNVTYADLDFEKIFTAILPKLSSLVIESLPPEFLQRAKDDNEPIKKKPKMEKIELLDIQVLSPSKKQVEDFELIKVMDTSSNFGDESIEIIEQNELSSNNANKSLTTLSDDDEGEEEEMVQLLEVSDIESESSHDDSLDKEDKEDKEEKEENPGSVPFGKNKEDIINYDTAMDYLSALQAYAVVNEHIDALALLDKIDTVFRKHK